MTQKEQHTQQQDKLIIQEYQNLIKQRQEQSKRNQLTYKNVSIWSDANYKPTKVIENNKHNFNIYADKLLAHLVIQQLFDFDKIAEILTYTFKDQGISFTSLICSERWYEIHRDRNLISKIKQKEMQNKRIKSIMNMTDPFILYNIDEKLQKMQKQEQISQILPKQLQYRYEGYNIFKDSIRRIDDIEKYNELKQQMREALKKAAIEIQIEKPMLYTPYYERLEQFDILEEQLTVEKMQKMLSHPIEMQVVERQLKVLDLNEKNFESKAKKQAEKKIRQEMIRKQLFFQIQDDWDEYESD